MDLYVSIKILASNFTNFLRGESFIHNVKERYYFPRHINRPIRHLWVNDLTIANTKPREVGKIDRQLPRKETLGKKSWLDISDRTFRQNSSNSRRSTAWRTVSRGHRSTFISSCLFSHRYANSLIFSLSLSRLVSLGAAKKRWKSGTAEGS